MTKKPKVKLLGQSGNAYFVLGACRAAARRAGWTKERIDAFVREAQSGDYDHLLATACEQFDVE